MIFEHSYLEITVFILLLKLDYSLAFFMSHADFITFEYFNYYLEQDNIISITYI